MKVNEILSHVDHTQLKAYCTWEDIRTLCEEATELHTASVCVPPCYIKRIKRILTYYIIAIFNICSWSYFFKNFFKKY